MSAVEEELTEIVATLSKLTVALRSLLHLGCYLLNHTHPGISDVEIKEILNTCTEVAQKEFDEHPL